MWTQITLDFYVTEIIFLQKLLIQKIYKKAWRNIIEIPKKSIITYVGKYKTKFI